MMVMPRTWLRRIAFGVAILSPMATLLAQPVLTAQNRYLIERRSTSVSALTAEDITYTTVKGNQHFEVVVPDRYVAMVSASLVARVEVLDADKAAQDCEEIMRDPTVSSCEPDVVLRLLAVPNDPSFGLQWHLRDVLRDADIKAPTAWDYSTGSSGVVVGVIDTGIYQSHPDLVANLWTNPNDPADGLDNDSNGFIDDVHGVNTALNSSSPEDLQGHGTHVSGIIASRGDNATGGSGVMWSGSLVVVSVASAGTGSFFSSDLVQAFDYLYDLKVAGTNLRVVNVSLGSNSYSGPMFTALSNLNDVDVLVVAAAGNEDSNNDSVPVYPANYNLPNIISVGATGSTQQLAYYSNYGTSVDIAAPGGDVTIGGAAGGIYSTYSTLVAGGSEYKYLQGTSMAAPVVTGALGLLAASKPSLTGSELKSLLLSTAETLPQLSSLVDSGRFLNVGAMLAAVNPSDSCPTDPGKTTPGVCGCGVADTDSDGDGAADCVDGCASDIGKTAAGVCGCGVSDADANNNSTPDCNDPVLAGVVPGTPTLKTTKGKVTVTMSARTGVLYLLKVTTKLGRAKAKTSYFSASTPTYTISRLKAKTSVSVSYQYYLSGTPVVSSSSSAVKKISSK
jgi:subtilisin family serine protease